jgi:hypothetical protein
MQLKVLTALLVGMFVFGAAMPARADRGRYDYVQFSNNTDYCVWLTIYVAPALDTSFKDKFTGSFKAVKAITVHPKDQYKLVQMTSNYDSERIMLRTQVYQKGQCTGTTIAERNINKLASLHEAGKFFKYGAVAQLDYGGGPNWNLYFGADKFLGNM